jgi:signal transduction histidine kinase
MTARLVHLRPLAAGKRVQLGDWLLAVGLLAIFEFPADHVGVAYALIAPNIMWAVTGAVMTLSLIVRRRFPLGVWGVTSASAALLLAFFVQFNPYESVASWPGSPLVVLPAPLVALYTLAAASSYRGRLAFGGSAAGFAVLMYGLAHGWKAANFSQPWPFGRDLRFGSATQYESPLLVTIVGLGMLVTAWALGETVRTRRESADVRRTAEAAEKAEHDRAVASEERARIARELHDITAHHISVVTLQAGTARLLAESGQPPSVELLRGIENASRQAMTEIRQALGVIRSTRDGAAPLPGLARLSELVTQMGLAGLTVIVDGEVADLPGGLDLTAYRIVQEGLTNVVRHSQATSARVVLRRGGQMLHITVTDDGPPRARPASGAGPAGGHGLIGLRERLACYGGRLLAGPRPDGGFGLRAMLPLYGAGDRPAGDTPGLPRARLPLPDCEAAALLAAADEVGAETGNLTRP